MMLESESESKSKIFGQQWNRNQNRHQLLLESELELESWVLKKPWNRNRNLNRNQP